MMLFPVWLPGPMFLLPMFLLGGLCLWSHVLSRGSLSRSASVQGVSVQGGSLSRVVCVRETPLPQRPPYSEERVVYILLECFV